MNPTKRTVMTLLARAKNAQTLHTLRHTTRHSEMAVVASALEQWVDLSYIPPKCPSMFYLAQQQQKHIFHLNDLRCLDDKIAC